MGSTNDDDTRPRRRGAAFVGFMFMSSNPQMMGGWGVPTMMSRDQGGEASCLVYHPE